jgi:hypothetical protein
MLRRAKRSKNGIVLSEEEKEKDDKEDEEGEESSRSWFRASSIIKLNKNQLDAHLF